MKKIIRGLFKYFTLLLAIIISPVFIVLGCIASYIDRFSDISIILAYIPLYFGENLRYVFYKVMLKKIGKNVVFKFGTYCQYRDAEIGNNCLFGYFNTIGSVCIGNDVICGTHIIFTSGLHQHKYDNPNITINKQAGYRTKIKVDSDIWIGNSCNIAANIGERCVIGIGATVINDLNPHGIYVGSPAKLVKGI